MPRSAGFWSDRFISLYDLARAFAKRLSAELELMVFDSAGKSVRALT